MFMIRHAVGQDLARVKELIQSAGMNDQGIDEGLQHFFIAENPAQEPVLVGAVGMEVYAPYGLLRSFVLERGMTNLRVGLQMMQILLAYAGHLRLSHVYLVAGANPTFFEQLGFFQVSPEELPDEIQKSEHVQEVMKQGMLMVYSCFPSQPH